MLEPKRIGVDATGLTRQPTGVGNVISSLLRPLCEAHHDARFFLYSNDAISFAPFDNVTHRVSTPKRRGPYWQNTHLRRMAQGDDLDVFWGGNGLMPVALPAGVGKVVTIHDFVYRFAPESLPAHSRIGRRLFQPVAVRQADRIVVVSAATGLDLERSSRRRASAVLHPLASRSLVRPERAAIERVRAGLGLARPYWLTLGTLEPRKNLVTLIEAFLDVHATGVALPTLAIAGGKGWRDGVIEDGLRRGEAAGCVRRLGYVDADDLPGLYAGCDVFLMASKYEGFGMPLLEAQLCGAPVGHGGHPAMAEAAGSLGVVLGTSRDELRCSLRQLALGELPLACRLRSSIANDERAASAALWQMFREAFAEGSKRRRLSPAAAS